MNFITHKLSGLKKRLKCFQYGIPYFRNSQFRTSDRLLINGIRRQLHFSDIHDRSFITEFAAICLADVYKLEYLKKHLNRVDKIVDVGANQGIFLAAARQQFAQSGITCYEPNKNLAPSLTHNANTLNAQVFYEAVTQEECMVDLNFTDSDLSTTITEKNTGSIRGVSLQHVIEREGGSIDILKLDCEGAEWQLLDDVVAFKNVAALTMEYHLWAKPGMTAGQLEEVITGLGFTIVAHQLLPAAQGILVAVKK